MLKTNYAEFKEKIKNNQGASLRGLGSGFRQAHRSKLQDRHNAPM